MKNRIYLSLGSNIGDRVENILDALSFLQSSELANIKKISSFYETSPVGKKQRNFCNIAAEIESCLTADDLLYLIKQAETILGRKKTVRWGPRVIDIDILFFNRETIQTSKLTIPHKEIADRLFVLVPLCEIAGNFRHPLLNAAIKEILPSKISALKKQRIKVYKKNSLRNL
jgi:2-amino-4-hydroxy-6-hydroxymethyldihydropteridine diphosphokinase